MNYSESGFDITLKGEILTFSGSLEKHDYDQIDAFLRQVDQSLSAKTCCIDITKLSFLNSSGIKSLAMFLLGSPKTFELHLNNAITWQKESIPPLACLKPDGIKIVSK